MRFGSGVPPSPGLPPTPGLWRDKSAWQAEGGVRLRLSFGVANSRLRQGYGEPRRAAAFAEATANEGGLEAQVALSSEGFDSFASRSLTLAPRVL